MAIKNTSKWQIYDTETIFDISFKGYLAEGHHFHLLYICVTVNNNFWGVVSKILAEFVGDRLLHNTRSNENMF